jgi:hypothetical protein
MEDLDIPIVRIARETCIGSAPWEFKTSNASRIKHCIQIQKNDVNSNGISSVLLKLKLNQLPWAADFAVSVLTIWLHSHLLYKLAGHFALSYQIQEPWLPAVTNISTHKSHWVPKAHRHGNEETVKPFLKQIAYPRLGNPAHVVKTNIWNPDSAKHHGFRLFTWTRNRS